MSCVTIHLLERWTHFLTSWLDSAELHEWSCIWWLMKIKSVSGSEDDDNSLIPTVYQNLCAFMSYTGFVAFEENAQCFILLFKCSFFVFFSFSNYNESQINAPHFQKKKKPQNTEKGPAILPKFSFNQVHSSAFCFWSTTVTVGCFQMDMWTHTQRWVGIELRTAAYTMSKYCYKYSIQFHAERSAYHAHDWNSTLFINTEFRTH